MTVKSTPRGGLGLTQRLFLAFVLVITLLAGLAVVSTIGMLEFTERTLVTRMMSEDLAQREAGAFVSDGSAPERLYTSASVERAPEYVRLAPTGLTELEEGPAVYIYKTVDGHGQWWALVRDQSFFENKERIVERVVLGVFALLIFAGVALGVALSRAVMRPVEALTRAVRRQVGAPEYRPLEVTPTDDEVGELARCCDRALLEVHEAWKRERAFTSDASHELRTPLSVVQTSCELLSLTPLTKEQATLLKRIEDACGQTSAMLDFFLAMARNETGETGRATLADVVSAQERLYAEAARERGLVWVTAGLDAAHARVRRHELALVLRNLLQNAFSYTPGGAVGVVGFEDGFAVFDTGPGVAEDEKASIFEARYRGRAAERAKEPGFGLGLSLSRRVAELCGWTLELVDASTLKGRLPESVGRPGAVFRVTWPKDARED